MRYFDITVTIIETNAEGHPLNDGDVWGRPGLEGNFDAIEDDFSFELTIADAQQPDPKTLLVQTLRKLPDAADFCL